jgi:hypothetical protein
MTEAEWLECTDIYAILEHLQGKATDRKFRLFAVACCHRPYYQVPDECYRKAVQLAERMTEEDVDEEEWRVVHQAAYELWRAASAASDVVRSVAPRGTPELESLMDAEMATAAGWVILEDAREAAYSVTGVEWDQKHADEPRHQLALLRDIIATPYRPAMIDPAWSTPTVASVARAAYEERLVPSNHLDPDRLAVLSDALEEAGCTDPTILSHLRSPGPHVRGCWALDLILGKA